MDFSPVTFSKLVYLSCDQNEKTELKCAYELFYDFSFSSGMVFGNEKSFIWTPLVYLQRISDQHLRIINMYADSWRGKKWIKLQY